MVYQEGGIYIWLGVYYWWVNKSENLKNFGEKISVGNFVIWASIVVLIVYQEGGIYIWLVVYYWWVKKSENLKNFGDEISGGNFAICAN